MQTSFVEMEVHVTMAMLELVAFVHQDLQGCTVTLILMNASQALAVTVGHVSTRSTSFTVPVLEELRVNDVKTVSSHSLSD